MASTSTKGKPATALERGLAKTAALTELYDRLKPENDGHRPLTADELKVQKANALTVAEQDAVQKDLYGRWVAAGDIHVGGVLAFVEGHRVPWTQVEDNGWDRDGLVVAVGSTEATEAEAARLAEATAETAELAAAEAAGDGK